MAKRLGDALVDARVADRRTVEEAAATGGRTGRRLGELLLEGGADEREIYRALAAQRGLVFTDEIEALLARVDPTLGKGVSRKFQDKQRVLPISLVGKKLVAVTCDPALDEPELGTALGAVEVELLVVTPTDFRRLRTAVDLEQLQRLGTEPGLHRKGGDLLAHDPVVDATLVALFHAILLDAIAERASDIHLERYGEQVRVRLRIDGDLRDARHYRISPQQLAGIINVVKVSASLDIAERRLPQGGRFSTRAGEHAFDLRVQTQPALHGEHVVIRLLPTDVRRIEVEELGFSPEVARTYRRLLDSPQGLVLVVGPTGSGKSTTLYAGLEVLASDETRKVITVEDPIEYAIDGVQQTQARPELGFAFAGAMRAFVREDPDVILVGEIRDGETALEALRASQTGHLVLSTLHCNDAVDAVQRLRDLGMHPNSIAAELLAVFAQRLTKRICEGCRGPDTPAAEELLEVFPAGPPRGFTSLRGRGCARCSGAGTHGRIAVVEFLPAGPALRAGIAAGLPLDELRAVARRGGLVPMRDQALRLVEQGLISFSELRQILPLERLAPDVEGPASQRPGWTRGPGAP